MSLLKSLAGQTLVYGMGHILPRVLHFIVFNSYLTYKWNDSPVEYAVYLDLYAYASVLLVIFSFRMDTAMFRFGQKEANLETTYVTALIPLVLTSLTLIAGGFYYSDMIAEWLTYPGQGHYVFWFSMIIAFDVVALLPYARYRLLNRALTFVKFKIANVLITVALVFFFLEYMTVFHGGWLDSWGFIENEVDLVFLSNLIASFVIMVIILFYNVPVSWKVNWALWKKMLYYAWPLIIVGVAGSINQFFAVPLQKYFLGEAVEINKSQAAVYGAVQKLAALLAMFTTAFNYAAEPFFFRNADRTDARTLYGDIALFFVVAAGMLSLGIVFFIDVFQFIVGPHFRQGLYLLPILLMAYVFLGLYYNVSIWYKLSDKTIYGALIAVIGATMTLTGSVLFLPKYGVIASAWTALACYSSMVLLAYVLGRKYYPIQYPAKKITFYLCLIPLFMALSLWLRTGHLAQDIFLGILLWLAFLITFYILDKSRISTHLLSGVNKSKS